MSSVLVTGGAGFIGGHLVDALVAKGHDVRVLDNLMPQVHPHKPDYLNPRAAYQFQDLRDDGAIKQALADVDIVYHLASAVGVGQSMYRIADYVSANTTATASLLQQLVDGGGNVRRLIIASSMSIYGEGSYRCGSCGVVHPRLREEDQLKRHEWELRCPSCQGEIKPMPTSESKPLAPTSIYAITKRDQEEMCLIIGRAYGIPTVALRFFNVYGPRQSLDNPYTGVCAIFLSRFKNGMPPIVFEDGQQRRDFVSVHDIVEACVLAIAKSGADFEAVNIGSGRSTSVLEIAEVLGKLESSRLQPVIENRFRAGDVRHCYADISKARRLLGYEPKISFEEGIRELVVWSKGVTAKDHFAESYEALRSKGLVEE